MASIYTTESESIPKYLLDAIPLGILRLDANGIILSANKQAGEILGIAPEELKGTSYYNESWKHFNEQGLPLSPDELPVSKSLKGDEVEGFIHVLQVGGEEVWISEKTNPLVHSDGTLSGCISCFSKVEKSKSSILWQDSIRTSRSGDSVRAIFWEWSLEKDRMTYLGPMIEDMLGYSALERSTKGFWESKIHPDDSDWAIAFHRQQVAEGNSHELEYRFRKKDGSYIWIRDVIDVISEDDRPMTLRGVMVDITKQKNTSSKLKESQELYQLLAENTSDLVSIHHFDFSYKFISPSVKDNLGYSDLELKELRLDQLFHPDDLPLLKERFIGATEGHRVTVRYRAKHKKGNYLWFESVLQPMPDASEQIRYVKNTARLVHDQKVAEDLLIESEVRYRSLINEAPFGISMHEPSGILMHANPAFETIWDIQIADLRGRFNINKEKEFKKSNISPHLEKAFRGESGEFSMRFKTVLGNLKDLQVKYFSLKHAEGSINNVVFLTEDISARVAAERNAIDGEKMKQSILDSLEDAILVVDRQGKILSVNQRLQNYLKRSPYRELSHGEDVFVLLEYFEDKDVIKTGLESVLTKSSAFFDFELKLADERWYNLKITQLRHADGAVISWQNINTRKEIEIALERSLRKYRNIYNRAPVMMHSVNEKSEIMSVSDFWLDKMGYDRKDVIGKKTIDFIVEESKEDVLAHQKKFFEEGSIRNASYRFQTKSGDVLEVLLSATSEYDENGNFERSLAGMVDVSDLRKTERELKRSRQDLLEAQRISKIGNYELDVQDKQFYPGAELKAMIGFSSDAETIDPELADQLIHENDIADLKDKLAESILTGADFFHVFRINHLKTKKLRWLSGRGKLIQDENGKFTRMIGTIQDISEQRGAEEKIRRLSDRILLATELAEIAVWEHSLETDEVYWDKQMYEIFEGESQPIRGYKGFAEFILQEDLPTFWKTVEKVKEGVRFIEVDLRMKIQNKVKYLRSYTRVIKDSKNNISRVLGVLYDNTKDKRLQLRLENSLEEKNILLKEVHHRVKNNMQLVSSILALKSYDLKDEGSKEIFAEINERIKSMAVIHDQLYKFYNVSEINISQYLEHIAGELQVLMGSANAVIQVEAEEKSFDVDKMLLFGLIVSELVSNAFKHGVGKQKDGLVRVIFKEEPGEVNYLAVLNTGSPMPADLLEMNSTGLGVSLIKTFARQLNGKVSLSEENGIEIRF